MFKKKKKIPCRFRYSFKEVPPDGSVERRRKAACSKPLLTEAPASSGSGGGHVGRATVAEKMLGMC